MALEAVEAQAGHRSMSPLGSTLHLASGWLEEECRRALDALDIPAPGGNRTQPAGNALGFANRSLCAQVSHLLGVAYTVNL